MTTTYNKARCAELVREMREDDARMSDAPWRAVASPSHEHYGRVDSPSWPVAQVLHDFDERPVSDELSESACSTDDTIGIARTRNRLRETADQLEAAAVMAERYERELSDERERVETMKAEVWEANEDNFKCGQIAAELGCLVANAPSDAVRTLANRYVEACEQRDAARAELASERKQFVAQVLEHDKVRERFEAELASVTAEADRRIAELEAEGEQFRTLCLQQSEQIADLRAAISVADRPRAVPPRHRWRAEPPAHDEVSERQWWWNRSPDGIPHILQLDRDPGSGLVFDGGEVNGACPPPFDPSDWPGEWAPCMTPDEVAARVSRIAEAGKRLVMSHVGKVRKLEGELATLRAAKAADAARVREVLEQWVRAPLTDAERAEVTRILSDVPSDDGIAPPEEE